MLVVRVSCDLFDLNDCCATKKYNISYGNYTSYIYMVVIIVIEIIEYREDALILIRMSSCITDNATK